MLFVTASKEHTGDPDVDGHDVPAEISVYDKASGEYMGGIELPDTPHGNLISYEHDGRQFLAVAVGGGRYQGGGGTPPELVALALPTGHATLGRDESGEANEPDENEPDERP